MLHRYPKRVAYIMLALTALITVFNENRALAPGLQRHGDTERL